MSRNKTKWENNFEISKTLLKSASKYDGDNNMIQEYAKALRNPIVFDNQVKSTTNTLPYKIPNVHGVTETYDHLVGMSNIVLYILKNKLIDRWASVDDFKKTLSALQVVVKCPKGFNNKRGFKTDWLFNYEDAEVSITWNEKLKKNGIYHLIDEKGEKVSVDTVWSKWFNENKKYL